MFLSGFFVIDFVTCLVLMIFSLILLYYIWQHSYWNRKQVPHLKPRIPWGNLPGIQKKPEAFGILVDGFYKEMRMKKWKHGGIYMLTNPVYMPIDLELIKHILTRDFNYFTDHGVFSNEKDDPLSGHLFNLDGDKWRDLRSRLTPVFTAGKIKTMFQTMINCERNLHENIKSHFLRNRALDIKEVSACFATDIICSYAFGFESNSFKEKDSPVRRYGKKFFQRDLLGQFKVAFMLCMPSLALKLRMKFTPQDVSDFFINLVKDTVSHRESKNFTRNDFIQILIDMKNEKLDIEDYEHKDRTFSVKEIAAHCFLFFIGGFETSSTTMAFALFELAKHQEIQEKVKNEIDTVLEHYGGEITYDSLLEMRYMQQVIDETLRKYPPVPFLCRICTKDYEVPDKDLIIEKGTRVLISVLGIHRDDEYYPEPEKFDPERFNEENCTSRHSYTYLPFGEGPRNCIGLRFGILQTKLGLASLLKSFRFTLNEKTPEPLAFRAGSMTLDVEGEIWLNAEAHF